MAPPVAYDLAELEDLLASPRSLRVVLQPIVALDDGAVGGYEALARLPIGEPAAVFAAAAQAGRAGELEAQVVEAALVLRPVLRPGRFLSVNLSQQALVSPGVTAALGQGSAASLVVEITAQGMPAATGSLLDALARLRFRGARIALDAVEDRDRLTLARALQPALLKVPVARLSDRSLVTALGAVVAETGAQVVASGVEDLTMLGDLHRLGVSWAQGRALAAPTPVPGELARDVADALRRPLAPRR